MRVPGPRLLLMMLLLLLRCWLRLQLAVSENSTFEVKGGKVWNKASEAICVKTKLFPIIV